MKIDSNNVIISIIVPMYNSANTVLETLESVRNQSFESWEVICVDDDSSDNSYSVVEEYSSIDSRISVYKRNSSSKGGSVCRNEGAQKARGEYLIFLDADDLLASTCLECRLRSIEKSSWDFVVFPMASFNNNIQDAKMYSKLKSKNELYCFASGAPTWQVTSPIMRKSFFEKIGGFDEKFQRYQDVEFHLRAIIDSNFNYKIMQSSVPDCFYRNSGSFNFSRTKLENSLIACSQLLNLFRSYKSRIGGGNAYALTILSIYMNYMLFFYGLKKIDNTVKFCIDINCLNDVCEELGYTWKKILFYLISLPYTRMNMFVMRVMRKSVYILISKQLV